MNHEELKSWTILLCPYIVAAKWVFKCYSCKNTQSLFSGMERRCWERCGCVLDKMRFPASCPGLQAAFVVRAPEVLPPMRKKPDQPVPACRRWRGCVAPPSGSRISPWPWRQGWWRTSPVAQQDKESIFCKKCNVEKFPRCGTKKGNLIWSDLESRVKFFQRSVEVLELFDGLNHKSFSEKRQDLPKEVQSHRRGMGLNLNVETEPNCLGKLKWGGGGSIRTPLKFYEIPIILNNC